VELLERAQVLLDLSDLLTEAAAGDGRLVLIAGEAGIGKTSVVAAFAQLHASDALVLTGGCDNLAAPSPLAPVADIARASGDHELGRMLAERTGTDLLFARLLDLLTGRGRPFLVIIEDAHWADESTLDLLRFLGRRITSERRALAPTGRQGGASLTAPRSRCRRRRAGGCA
jgi:predicted ATPase